MGPKTSPVCVFFFLFDIEEDDIVLVEFEYVNGDAISSVKEAVLIIVFCIFLRLLLSSRGVSVKYCR